MFTNHSARKINGQQDEESKIVSSERIANVTGQRGINFPNDYDESHEKKRR